MSRAASVLTVTKPASGFAMHAHAVERYFVAQPILVQLCICDAVHLTARAHRREKVQKVVDTRARGGRWRALLGRDEDRGCWVEGEEIEKDAGQARGPIRVDAIADDDHIECVSRGQRRVALARPVWTPAEWEHLHWCNVLTQLAAVDAAWRLVVLAVAPH